MTKARSIFPITGIFALVVLGVVPTPAQAQECHIKIGALFPMTGPAAPDRRPIAAGDSPLPLGSAGVAA